MYKYVIFGAGAQGEACAWWLLQRKSTVQVTIADWNVAALDNVVGRLADIRVIPEVVSLPDQLSKAKAIMAGCDVAMGATSYTHYVALTEAAIEAGCHWADFGGKIEIRRQQALLSDKALANDVMVAPDQGIAPGSASICLLRALHALGGRANRLWCRVGGLTLQNIEPIDYAWHFAADGLIQEMEAPAEVVMDGQLKAIKSLTGLPIGHMDFPPPFNRLWHVPTSDGAGTFFETYLDRVEEGGYTTLRRTKEHWKFMIALRELGFWNPDPVRVDGVEISPRSVTVANLDANLPRDVPSALVLGIEGVNGGLAYRSTMIVHDNQENGHSSMQISTGYSGAITMYLMATGQVSARGEVRLERDFPERRYIELMHDSGMELTEEFTLDDPECANGSE